MTTYHNVEQRTQEWFDLKNGKLTNSKKHKIVQPTTGLLKTNKQTVLKEVYNCVAEIETDGLCVEDVYVTPAMERGNYLEDEARQKFWESQEGHIDIDIPGFITNSKYEYGGCSPDGMNQERTIGIEIKCPSSAKHIEIVKTDRIPNEWKPQVYGYFMYEDRLKYMYFISYDDRVTKHPLHVIKVKRTDVEDYIYNLDNSMTEFCAMVKYSLL